jgi:signal peptidase II
VKDGRGRASGAWWRAGALCAFVILLDQVTKGLVEERIVLGEHIDIVDSVGLTLSHNDGVAFGLAGGGGAGLIVLTVAALALVAALFARNPIRPGMWVAFGLVAGGAVGNLADRIRLGAVTDFIDFPRWPNFNLADIAITTGVLVLAFIYLRDAEE